MGFTQSILVCVWSLLAIGAFIGMFFNPAHIVTFAISLAMARYSYTEKTW
jgi:hypothetical protein